jgi:hypothetical protein
MDWGDEAADLRAAVDCIHWWEMNGWTVDWFERGDPVGELVRTLKVERLGVGDGDSSRCGDGARGTGVG